MTIQKFTIGEDWAERYPLTDEHKEELREKIGVHKLPGWPPYEIVKDGEQVFYRSLYTDKKTHIDNYLESLDDSQILCQCGSKAFEVRLNSDSGVFIKCVVCGTENEFSF